MIGEGDGVGELFGGVDGELVGDVHVLRAFEDLRVVDVGDDGLVLAGEVFVEEVDEFFAGEGGGWCGCFCGRTCLLSSPMISVVRGLRFEMHKRSLEFVTSDVEINAAQGEQQIPPLRCASSE